MTDVEQRFDDARSRLRDLTSSSVLQGFNSSSLGELLPHESLVLHMVRGQKRLVNEMRMMLVIERKLAALRLLGGKSVNKRLGELDSRALRETFRREDVEKPEATRAFWKMKVREAQQCGQSPELSFEKFQKVLRLVKPNLATGRDNVPVTILRLLPGSVQTQL